MKNYRFLSVCRQAMMVIMLLAGTMAYAQTTVSGTVVDAANGEPVIGASVLVMGTTSGTITDFDGNFTLSAASDAVLQVSYMGYKTLEVPVAGQKVLKINLHEDNELLDEVVVVGYGVVKKNDATGSVTAIKPDEMNKGLVTNAQDMLQGKIAGVNVVAADGTPGGAANITIRGGASLNASNSPLIVIDGLAMDNNGIPGAANPLSMVNPSDIESFTVLKDASATAIYGSRASNGVIIITTKKGAKGSKPRVTYNGNVSVGMLTDRLQTLTGDQLRTYASQIHKNSKTKYLGTANTDWQDQIYRAAISTDHNVSIAGGTANMPYRFSLGYTDQNGTLKTSNMQRVTAAVSLSPSFLDNHLNLNINAKGLYIYNRYADGGAVGAALGMDPTAPVYGQMTAADGTVLGATTEQLDQFFGGYYQRTKSATYGDDSWPICANAQSTKNPLAMLEQKNDRANSGSFVGNFEADYKIHGFEDLHIHANFGADYSAGRQNTSCSPFGASNHYYGWEGTTLKHKYNLQFSAYAQYYKDFSETQHFDIMLGYESQYFYNDYFSDGAGTYQPTNGDATLAGKDYNRTTNQGNSDNALQSFYGRVNWNGWNQILLTATFRADGSSRFAKYDSLGKNARWGLFPSVALGWKIKETFLQDVNAINDLKLRLGYGITGQQDLGYDYYYLPTFTYNKDHAYYPVGYGDPAYTDGSGNAVYGSSRPGVYNLDLTWEKTTTYNAGIDFAFLNNRISGNLDYYFRNTKDLLSEVNVPAGANFKNIMMGNIGSLRNQGVEFAINAVVVDRKNFKWDLGLNAAWNNNKITQLLSDEEGYYVSTGGISCGTGNTIQAHMVGYAAKSFLVYETKELKDEAGNTVFAVVDRNHDGMISSDDKYIYKSPDAKVTLGFQTKFQFYGVDLGVTMRAALGNYVYNDVLAGNLGSVSPDKVYSAQNGGYQGVLRSAYDLYWKTGLKSDGMYGILYNEDGSLKGTEKFSDWFACDYFVENASFLRIDNITLGYTFSKPKVNARIFCTVSNPCVISGYSGLDPEVNGGIDNNIYPRSMTTVVGCSLQF